MKMRVRIAAASLALAFGFALSLPETSSAATVVLGPPNAVTGIQALTFSDNAYNYSANVSFVTGLYGDAYLSPPTFLNNATAARNAATAIADAFNTAHTTSIAGVTLSPSPSAPEEFLAIPYKLYTVNGFAAEDSFGPALFASGLWQQTTGSSLTSFDTPAYWSWAVFSNVSATPVPLPAAAWLLLSGLGAVGGFARIKRTVDVGSKSEACPA